jgi:glycosyltransferase involved in cell wall biosynthesis
MLDRWAFKFSDVVLADTQAHKDYYCRSYGVPGAKVAVLPLGYDDEIYRDISRKKESPVFRVLFFGSFLPLHGADVIVEAAAAVARHDSSIQFKLVGSGQTFPRVKSLAESAGLRNVLFEGWMSQELLAEEISAAAVTLGIFGRTEKAKRVVPHKIFQSMGMGKPVITCRTPAAEEFFVHKKHIYYCDAPDPELLARAILELKEDQGLRQEIAQGGAALVRERHSPRAIGRMLSDILRAAFAFPR